jgi:hypothetical protein
MIDLDVHASFDSHPYAISSLGWYQAEHQEANYAHYKGTGELQHDP